MTSKLFTIVEDAQAILRTGGVFKQVAVYQRKGQLYAGSSSGMVMLLGNSMTSRPNTRWEDIDGVKYTIGEYGRLVIK